MGRVMLVAIVSRAESLKLWSRKLSGGQPGPWWEAFPTMKG